MLSRLDPAHRRIAQGFIVLGAVCALAVGGYVLTGWSLSDAVYMVTITIFGVGAHARSPRSYRTRALANDHFESTAAHMKYCAGPLRTLMDKVRLHADALETEVADEFWPLPKYREMLFIK